MQRGVDDSIVALVHEVASRRNVMPPTTQTKQLLLACEPDGYAAARVGTSTLSLFFDPHRARQISERHGLEFGQRSEATWIVRVPGAQLSDPVRRDLVVSLFEEALDRVAPHGAWNRGLDDTKKAQGEVCPIHFVQRSLTGVCPECE
jgi:hypothetical protein